MFTGYAVQKRLNRQENLSLYELWRVILIRRWIVNAFTYGHAWG